MEITSKEEAIAFFKERGGNITTQSNGGLVNTFFNGQGVTNKIVGSGGIFNNFQVFSAAVKTSSVSSSSSSGGSSGSVAPGSSTMQDNSTPGAAIVSPQLAANPFNNNSYYPPEGITGGGGAGGMPAGSPTTVVTPSSGSGATIEGVEVTPQVEATIEAVGMVSSPIAEPVVEEDKTELAVEAMVSPLPPNPTGITPSAELKPEPTTPPGPLYAPGFRGVMERSRVWYDAIKRWLKYYFKTEQESMFSVLQKNKNTPYDNFTYSHPLCERILELVEDKNNQLYISASDALNAGKAAHYALYDLLMYYNDLVTAYINNQSNLPYVECAYLEHYFTYVYLLRIKHEKRRIFDFLFNQRLNRLDRTTLTTPSAMGIAEAAKYRFTNALGMTTVGPTTSALTRAKSLQHTTTSFLGIPRVKQLIDITPRELLGLNFLANEIFNYNSCTDPRTSMNITDILKRCMEFKGEAQLPIIISIPAATDLFKIISEKIEVTLATDSKTTSESLLTRIQKIVKIPGIENIAKYTTMGVVGTVGLPLYLVSSAKDISKATFDDIKTKIQAGVATGMRGAVPEAGARTINMIGTGLRKVPGIAEAGIIGLHTAAKTVGPPVKEAAKIAWPHVRDAALTLPAVAGAVVGFPYLGHMTRISPGTGSAGRSGGGAGRSGGVAASRTTNNADIPSLAGSKRGYENNAPSNIPTGPVKETKIRRINATSIGAVGNDAVRGAGTGITGGGAGGMNDDTLPPSQAGGYRKTRRAKHKKTRKARLNRKVRKTRVQRKRLTRRR